MLQISKWLDAGLRTALSSGYRLQHNNTRSHHRKQRGDQSFLMLHMSIVNLWRLLMTSSETSSSRPRLAGRNARMVPSSAALPLIWTSRSLEDGLSGCCDSLECLRASETFGILGSTCWVRLPETGEEVLEGTMIGEELSFPVLTGFPNVGSVWWGPGREEQFAAHTHGELSVSIRGLSAEVAFFFVVDLPR
jgi:hypothetical protein